MNTIRSIEMSSAGAVAEAAEEVRENGAVVLRGIISADLAGRLRDELTRAMDEDLARFGPAHVFPGMVHALMLRGPSFLELLSQDAIRAVGRAILGHGAIVHAFNSSCLPPNATNYAGRVHVDSPRHVPGYATNIGIAMPLDAFTIENGAMEIWPQSFGMSETPSDQEFEANKVVLAGLLPGDAVCFNARCFHKSGINTTAAWRHAATLNLCRAYMRQQFDFPRMIPADISAKLSEDVQQFLGYHVRMPVSMDEFLAPPDQRPYRPGQE
ncbi:MAG TPA: phytanoyl-CoA dioxygenase family protein [Thermoanaerobaculia bacterium]|jgi:ectoine hydroxylase-related dioxygenase (phytanoyl-CoA dioxygenase family)|nr:phytanoyl-CoA dioxygenase family protein [Thermoanaerobaculia bacterium]